LFQRRVRHHVETKLHFGPTYVLKALAAHFKASELDLLLLRLGTERDSALSAEMISSATDEVEQEMLVRAEHAVESAPSSMILWVLAALFVPLLAMTILPLASSFASAMGFATGNLTPAAAPTERDGR
jgi:hypothetical protein